MSQQVNVGHVNQYSADLDLLLQQQGSRIAPHCIQRSYMGKGVRAVNQLGQVAATEITARHSSTEVSDTPHAARWIFPRDFGVADLVDKEDLLRMLTDPSAGMATAQSWALGRKQDDLLIAALTDDAAVIGEDGEETTTLAADGVTLVDDGVGGPMTTAKLRAAKKNLMAANNNMNEDFFCAMTAVEIDEMLVDTQAINLDFNTKPVLVDGKITSFMGFNFVHTEQLILDSNGDRICPVWARSGLISGTWNSTETMVDRRPDLWGSSQIMSKGTFGATRTEGGKVVLIKTA